MCIWFQIVGGVVVIGSAVAMLTGYILEASKADLKEASLLQSASQPVGEIVSFDAFGKLPPPVERYFRYILRDGQALINTATLRQTGIIRTSIQKEEWSSFTARHLAVPLATGFIWNAKVETPIATHVRVLDSYIAGIGSGRVSLLSAVPVVSQIDTPELNSGALHRYLAEAVWYPTALLPQSDVVWSPIDDSSAMATLTNIGATVSLEFRFNDVGEVTGIFTPARFGHFDGRYRQVPWEGHFHDYQTRAGMRVPLYGEVGWYANGKLELVWKGNITDAKYDFIE